MFFLSITKANVSNKMQSKYAEEFLVGSWILTIITDRFMSKIDLTEDGFSIFESPMIDKDDCGNVLLSQVLFKKSQRLLEIIRPTASGRTIYYHLNQQGDFFCSTHISMLQQAGVAIEENITLLPEFFVYRYIMPPRTLYKNIYQLSAGSLLEVGVNRKNLKVHSQVSLIQISSEPSNRSDSTEASPNIFIDKLNNYCSCLKPLSNNAIFLLSGGLDSSILCKICQRNLDVKATYSAGYPFEEAGDGLEKNYAFSAAESFGLQHNYYKPSTRDYLFGILEAISVSGVPLHHLQSVLFYLLLKNCFNKDKAIVLSGLGADGIFGNEFHQEVFKRTRILKHKDALSLFYPFAKLLKTFSQATGRARGLVSKYYWDMARGVPLSDPDHVIWQHGRYGDVNWVCNYFDISIKDIVSNRYDAVKKFRNHTIFDVISMLCFLGSTSVTQDIWSKVAEAHNKIVHYPFTDIDLIEEAFVIPWEAKLSQPKNILRKVGKQLLIPDYIVSRAKSSWGVPPERWGGKGGAFEPLVPLISKVFDIKQIRIMQANEEHKAMTFWNIINYSIWKRLCINNEPLEALKGELQESLSCGETKSKWFIDSRIGTELSTSKSTI